MICNFYNRSIFYNCFGKGPAIILLHGFLESSTMWERLIPVLSKNNRVVILDFPGHGKSEQIAEVHSMELMAEVVKHILHTLQIKKVTLIGHSMGGYISLAIIELYNEMVEKVILLNSSTLEDDMERKQNRTRALKIIDKNHVPFVQMAINNLFPESSHKMYVSEIKMLKNEALTFPPEGIKAAIKGMRDRKDRTSVLKNFSGNKILVCGKIDPLISLETSKYMASQTSSELKILAGGHMSLIENYDEIVKICTLS